MSSRGELPFFIVVVGSVRSFNGFVNLKSSVGVQKATVASRQHELTKRTPVGILRTKKKAKAEKWLFFLFQGEFFVLETRLSEEQVPIVLELDSRDFVQARMV